jgi:membrane fusion protein, multidrug efflux system
MAESDPVRRDQSSAPAEHPGDYHTERKSEEIPRRHKRREDEPEQTDKKEEEADEEEDEKAEKKDDGKPPLYKRPMFIISAIIVGMLLLVAVLLIWLYERHFESTDDAFIDGHVVQIGPQVAGLVSQLLVNDNQDVAAGQLLLVIDPSDFDARLAEAQAGLAQAQGQLDQARAQVAVNQANTEQARADVLVAEANAQNAQTDRARLEAVGGNAVPEQQIDNARAAAGSTAAQLESAKKKVVAAEAQVALAKSQIAAASANVKSAEAGVEAARLQVSYTRIRAPQAGRITHRTVEAGNYIQVGQELLAIVPRDLWVTANFKETQLRYMKRGDAVRIRIDTYGRRDFAGHVDSIQAGSGAAFSLLPPENATGNYVKVVQRVPVKITFDRDTGNQVLLAPGMSVVPKVRVR